MALRTLGKHTQSQEQVFVLAASPPIMWSGTNEGIALQLGGQQPLQRRSAFFLWGKQEEEVR